VAGISEFMDGYTGGDPIRTVTRGLRDRPGRRLAEAGPNCNRIARAAGTPQFAEQILSTLFWWCFVRTDNPAQRAPGGPQILAGHGQGTRFDLLVLSPTVRRPFAVRLDVNPHPFYAQGAIRTLPDVALAEGETMQAMLRVAGVRVDARVAVLAVTELDRSGGFQVVLAPSPEQTRTGGGAGPGLPARPFVAPAAALPVTFDDDPRAVATAGVVAAGDDGLLVTTARHVIETAAARSAKLAVGGMPATVVGQPDVLTDSCVLAVGGPIRPGAGAAGPLRRPPVLYLPATFAGAASGPTKTKIIAFDLGVVSPTPHSGGRVYTDPDTIPGDSGAALIDADDHIVGFAVDRTAFGAPVEFSSWSWAEQVLAAHGLG
jgi:hypothetical protein